MKSEAELRIRPGECRTRAAVSHLYVHIPFCARICPYCAFYKEQADPSQTQRFCEALLRELDMVREQFPLRFRTIFFGGGTPTALTTTQLAFLLGGMRERLDLAELREWTLEANPGSVSPRKAVLLRDLGVTRLSLGVQSWDDALLRLLGREHDAAQAENSFQTLRDAGFQNISLDLMFGLPGQTRTQWEADLTKSISLQPDHISTYCLTYEEDTDFFLRHARGEFRADTESDAQLLERTMAILEGAGYRHYEISNYARPGFESVHNRGYWAGHDYLGIGPSAVSTVGSKRWQNVCDYRAYADRVLAGELPIASTENLTPEMKRTERIALGLRTRDGIPARELEAWRAESEEFLKLGLLRESDGNFLLTPRGKLLADSVAGAFI
ncbi:MAG TPA: radical SAM family heme chaperone HemW [Chthoniobacterales bacterium]|jgi:oxygen-independent coproporphyrinogen-3 oxidase|nr:radical SAM family heme chaperone HemW [Chthoniobacterales bacterium]